MIAIFNHLFPATPFKKKWHFIGTLATILFSIFTFISFYSRHPERYFSSICLLYVSCFLILRVIRSKNSFPSLDHPKINWNGKDINYLIWMEIKVNTGH